MIPDIGFMVAAYIITRMTELLTTSGAAIITRIFAALTILVAVGCGIDLVTRGIPLPPMH